MDEWEQFNEKSLRKKDNFYSNQNMEDITYSGQNHAKRVSLDFEIKNLCEYHDLYLKSDTLLLTDIFETFRKMCLETYQLDPINFL